MSDPYSNLGAQDTALQERIANAMEARSLEPAQVAIRKAYLGNLRLAQNARAIELGSGTGHVTSDLLEMAGAASAHGIEPSPVMVARARKTFGDDDRLSFGIGDARNTGLEDG